MAWVVDPDVLRVEEDGRQVVRAHELADLLDEARAIGESYGVRVIPRMIRSRKAGRALVDEAIRRHAAIIAINATIISVIIAP